MKINFTSCISTFFDHLRTKGFYVLLCLLMVAQSKAQTTISTTNTFANTDSASTITFNFQNTNTFPVLITKLEGIVKDYGSHNVEIWYKNSAINGLPGAITVANGWALATGNAINGIGNTTNTTETQNFFNTLGILVPAGSTYGIAVLATNTTGLLRIGNVSALTTIAGGGCNIITSNTVGYAGAGLSPAPADITGKAWIGKITFINGSNCAGTPNTATISGPASICTSTRFTLSSTGQSAGAGITYQWQYFNTTTNTWTNLTGATGTQYTNLTGNTVAVQYRMKTLCSFSNIESISNTLTVGVGSTMNGVYTINNAAPSSGTNFVSFSDAAAALQCGINGLVTLNVVRNETPYEEAPVFGNIPGASSTNRIILNGNGATLQYLTTFNDINILHLRGTKYIKVDSLHIRSLAQQYAFGITLSDTAKLDTIISCFVDMRSMTGNAISNFSSGISLSGHNTASNTAYASKCYVAKNYVLGTQGTGGPYYGIMDGYNYISSYTNNDTGNVIAYNTVENFAFFGITVNNSYGSKVLYNDVHRTNKTASNYFVGIRSWGGGYSSNQTSNYYETEIIGNRIHNPAVSFSTVNYTIYGIQLYSNYGGFNTNHRNSVLVSNNAIYNIQNVSNTGTVFGIYFWTGYYNDTLGSITKIYHNTVDITTGSSNSIAAGIGGYDNYTNSTITNFDTVLIKNNLVTINGVNSTANKFGLYLYSYNNAINTFSQLQLARNNVYFYPPQTSNLFHSYFFGTNYSTLGAFQAANPAYESGSLSVDPQYFSTSTGDLTPMNPLLFNNGTNLQSEVPLDILGRPRSTSPTPGAFEKGIDAGVLALLSPIGTFCSSNKEVNVSVKNFGLTTINNVQVHWSLNGAMQPPVTYSGALSPNAVTTVTLGSGLFLPNTPVTVKAWTYLPNGQLDIVASNDTITTVTQSSTSIPVDLGPDDTICVGNTKVLNAGYPGWSHVWNGNVTGQTRTVSQAGTYYVRVMALDGCLGFDTFNLSLRPLPVVNLGPDVEICWGQTATFDAGHPGSIYFWDDGSSNQTRTVDTAGVYEVQVTDVHGCMGVDQAQVTMKDMPIISGINATHADSGTYTFYPLNPQYILNYRWNFGDGSPEEVGYMVQHTYATTGIYTVTLFMEGECTGLIVDQSRTVDVFVVKDGTTVINGNQKKETAINLYPNPTNNQLFISCTDATKIQEIKVYNLLGQLIAEEKMINNTHYAFNTATYANGMYTIKISLENDEVLNRKFEVLR